MLLKSRSSYITFHYIKCHCTCIISFALAQASLKKTQYFTHLCYSNFPEQSQIKNNLSVWPTSSDDSRPKLQAVVPLQTATPRAFLVLPLLLLAPKCRPFSPPPPSAVCISATGAILRSKVGRFWYESAANKGLSSFLSLTSIVTHVFSHYNEAQEFISRAKTVLLLIVSEQCI